MKFAALILAALAAGATAASVVDLEARSCTPSKCRCVGDQTQFCGNEKINSYCTNGHVFECNAKTGNTCDYGIRKSCVKCGKLSC